ncbi:cytochrome [bacterium RCC_150]
MTDPVLAHATEYGRMYARSTSESFSVPSITTVIGQQAHSLDGWFGYMGASSLARDPELPQHLSSPAKMREAVNRAAKAAEVYRDDAARRGDRVHYYCEQVALRALRRPHRIKEAREELAANGEEAFAARFDEWWDLYKVEPLAPEITVWNASVGYAGTLDLVARINGRVCLIDYKTKGTTRDGTVKPLDDKVVMQLVAGMKAEESLVDPVAGDWEAWKYGDNPILLAVAIGETEVRPQRANPDVLKHHWWKFCALKRVWEMSADVVAAGTALLPIAPPSYPVAPQPEGAGRVPVGSTKLA